MSGKSAALATVVLLIGGGAAHAASGSLKDPSGDYPDIVKLNYSNAQAKVIMKMTYAEGHPQNESFYVRWGSKGKRYQVFNSPSAGLRELRYYTGSQAVAKRVACGGLKVTQPSATATKVVVPRKCLPKAPAKLRFQGIATEGLFSKDETKISKAVPRG